VVVNGYAVYDIVWLCHFGTLPVIDSAIILALTVQKKTANSAIKALVRREVLRSCAKHANKRGKVSTLNETTNKKQDLKKSTTQKKYGTV